MNRSGLAAALAIAALGLGGCGGDDGDDQAAGPDAADKPAAVASTPGADGGDEASEAARADGEKKRAGKRRDRGEARRDSARPTKQERRELLEELRANPEATVENASAKQKARLIKQAALAATSLLGLKLASVESSRDGSSALLNVVRRTACVARPEDDAEIAGYMKKGVPTLRTVRVEVGGTGQTLASYTRSSCKAPSLPPAKGDVLLVQSGPGTQEGLVKTKYFRTTQKKWVIEYDNRANYLSVFVQKTGGKRTDGFAATTRRGIGRQVITLKPGRYRLSVSGAAWTVRVRDGV
jgi:hypothetical protein